MRILIAQHCLVELPRIPLLPQLPRIYTRNQHKALALMQKLITNMRIWDLYAHLEPRPTNRVDNSKASPADQVLTGGLPSGPGVSQGEGEEGEVEVPHLPAAPSNILD
jgi:hypothetical protein